MPVPGFGGRSRSTRREQGPDDLVFGGIRGGEALRVSLLFRKPLSAAVAVIGIPDLHPHELRHSTASLAIASGAVVKVVQQMLGHRSATMTLDAFGHLFENRLDEVVDAMDLARTNGRRATDLEPLRYLLLPECCPRTIRAQTRQCP